MPGAPSIVPEAPSVVPEAPSIVPVALDPDRLFPQDDAHAERLGERRALEALAAEFGVRLPRFALSRGRLHSFRTRPWNRPPGPGEGYVTLGVVRAWP
ncbi:hypothetical protein ACFY3M_16305 [Streptomyces mirabilis]|uniref:hypothetical protein n=1 Tax=Streptomyces mirabilis TaxID=68239 RepID=UPI0036C2C071